MTVARPEVRRQTPMLFIVLAKMIRRYLLFNISKGLDLLGKYEEAEQMYWQILELREQVLAKEHPDTFISMKNLALVLGS